MKAVGIHDRFFSLGGNSLLLMRVLDRLRSRLGLTLSLTDLFQYSSIHALVQHLSAAGDDAESSDDAAARAAKQTRARTRAKRQVATRIAQ
jgi:hypothetical protein